ncbi:hypothetical protein A9Q84_13695 [Halobacteriovorax marinus]|uniref:KilA-N DNA-binding domain-containing protein n=1 Tax=Halobacteriovorax marinus TaxID=97084 RepID=A0A1Y5F920_9BACT|nr:hypothetical protein A9Q84_13695 [Halobacteriovorax marinus]
MFRISPEEHESLRSQFVTSNEGRGGRRYQPHVFTENGVAMLSSILKSETAIDVNIAIMRTFTQLRSFMMLEKELVTRMSSLEMNTAEVFKVVFEKLDSLDEQLPSFKKDRV